MTFKPRSQCYVGAVRSVMSGCVAETAYIAFLFYKYLHESREYM